MPVHICIMHICITCIMTLNQRHLLPVTLNFNSAHRTCLVNHPSTHTWDQATIAGSWLQGWYRMLASSWNMVSLNTAGIQASKTLFALSFAVQAVWTRWGCHGGCRRYSWQCCSPRGFIILPTETMDLLHRTKVRSLDQGNQYYLDGIRLFSKSGLPETPESGPRNLDLSKLQIFLLAELWEPPP